MISTVFIDRLDFIKLVSVSFQGTVVVIPVGILIYEYYGLVQCTEYKCFLFLSLQPTTMEYCYGVLLWSYSLLP